MNLHLYEILGKKKISGENKSFLIRDFLEYNYVCLSHLLPGRLRMAFIINIFLKGNKKKRQTAKSSKKKTFEKGEERKNSIGIRL